MIILIYLFMSTSHASQATNAAILAAYKQTGTEEYVNTVVKDLDNKYLTDVFRQDGALALILLECAVKQELTWKWTF